MKMWKFSPVLVLTWMDICLGVVLPPESPSIGNDRIDMHLKLKLIPDDYDKKLPPPQVDGKPHVISVTMDVFSIPKFDEKDEDIMLEIRVTHIWEDLRINTDQIKDSVELDPRTITDFWTPDSYFHHAKDAKFIGLMTPTAGLRIYSNKTIRYSTMIMLTLGCPMSFANFPMDTQVCEVELQSFGYDTNENAYVWIRPPALMKGIKIDNHEVNNSMYNFTYKFDGYEYPGLGMNISLKRHLQYHVTQTYIPSIIFVVVAWLSFFVPSDVVPGRMVLCVTTLLVLTSMFSSVRSLTPQVSYMKAIDLWVFVCILFVFSTLAEYAFILHLTSRSKWQQTMDEHLRTISGTEKLRNVSRSIRFGSLALHDDAGNFMRNRINPEDVSTDLGTPKEHLQMSPLKPDKPESPESKKSGPNQKLRIAYTFEFYAKIIYPTLFFLFNVVYWTYFLSQRT